MSEQITPEINFTEFVERRKILLLIYNEEPQSFGEKEENELQEINKQIKKAEWLLMRAMFWMQECFVTKDGIKKLYHFDPCIIINTLNLFFLRPNPQKFKSINHILNQQNVKDMKNALINLYIKRNFYFAEPDNYNIKLCMFNDSGNPVLDSFNQSNLTSIVKNMFNNRKHDEYIDSLENLTEQQKKFLKDFYEQYMNFINKYSNQINYTANCLPQTSQGNNFFTNQMGHFFIDHDRNFAFSIDNINTESIIPHAETDDWISDINNENIKTLAMPVNSFTIMNFKKNLLIK